MKIVSKMAFNSIRIEGITIRNYSARSLDVKVVALSID